MCEEGKSNIETSKSLQRIGYSSIETHSVAYMPLTFHIVAERRSQTTSGRAFSLQRLFLSQMARACQFCPDIL